MNIKNLRKPITLEEKYKVAVNALQAIAQRGNGQDEWDAAHACYDIQRVASETLERLGENTFMNNKK
ncbi:MAG: hypothetical protein J6D08_13365 [Lachnospiraceae bacterium]|nr:hypothetical protein [Lachnospiraceae bacterium]